MKNEFPSISILIPDLVNGGSDSWEQLVATFQCGLTAKARQLLFNSGLERRCDPEELVNITFTKAWKSHQQLRAQTTRQVAAFLITILRNTFIELCRPKNLEASSPSWFAPTTAENTPSEIMISEENEIQLHATLAELPEHQRKVLVMRHLEGMKFREIAEALDTTSGTIAGLARNGLEKLRSRFQLPDEID